METLILRINKYVEHDHQRIITPVRSNRFRTVRSRNIHFFITSDEIINRKTILSIEFSKAAISIDRFLSVRLCVRLNQSEKCVGVEH